MYCFHSKFDIHKVSLAPVLYIISKPAYLWSDGEGKAREDSVLEPKVAVVGLFARSLLDSLDELLLLLS